MIRFLSCALLVVGVVAFAAAEDFAQAVDGKPSVLDPKGDPKGVAAIPADVIAAAEALALDLSSPDGAADQKHFSISIGGWTVSGYVDSIGVTVIVYHNGQSVGVFHNGTWYNT